MLGLALWRMIGDDAVGSGLEDQHLLDAGADAWQQLTPELLLSVCACPYLTHELKA
jgi:hypothetical protein